MNGNMVTSVDMNAEEYTLTGLEQNIDYIVEVGAWFTTWF